MVKSEHVFDINETKDLSNWELDIPSTQVQSAQSFHTLSEVCNIKLETIDDVRILMERTSIYRRFGKTILYRGISKSSYDLIPTIAHNTHSYNIDREKKKLKLLKTICKSDYEKYKLKTWNENYFYMAIGRHLGYKCQLLDWSSDIWVSLSFLSNENVNENGILWVMAVPNSIKYEQSTNPLNIKDNIVHLFRENYYLPQADSQMPLGILRCYKQHGFFTATRLDMCDIPLNKILQNNLQGIELCSIQISSKAKRLLCESNKCYKPQQYMITEKDIIINTIKLLLNTSL